MRHVLIPLLGIPLVAVASAGFAQDPITATPVWGVTLDRPADIGASTYDKPVNLTSISAGEGLFSDFIVPTQVTSSTSPANYAIYWGVNDPGRPLDNSTLDGVLLDADITTGALSLDALGNGTLDLLFPQTITDQNGAMPDLFLFDLDLAGSDTWIVKALISDGGGSYTEGPAKTFSSMGFSGVNVNYGISVNQTTSTYPVYGAGLDLGQLGVSELIGLQVSSPAGDPSVLVAPQQMEPLVFPEPKILDVTMEDVVHNAGLETEYTTRDLIDITIDRGTAGPKTVAVGDMIGIDVSRYRSDTQTVVLAQARGGPDPDYDQRAALLEDISLNTGLTNVGTGSGLTAPPDANTVGIQVDFAQAVVNGPGADVVIFDMDNGANPVPVVVSRLDADGEGTGSVEITIHEYAQFGGADLAIQVYRMLTPLSLVDLENNGAENIAAASNWKLFAAGIDLSDLGYAEDETVSGLFFQSSPNSTFWWDPVFIAGMPEVTGGLDGDLNGDGFVGGDDLDIVRSFWGQNVTAGDLLSGDPSADGFVGGDDLDIVRANWGQGTPPAPSAVPEPATGLLAMVGLAMLLVLRRRSR